MSRRPDSLDEKIGHKVRARRKLTGFSSPQFASILGISHQQLHKYETGANRITATQLAKMARILNVDVSYFFNDSLLAFEKPLTTSFRATEIVNEPETSNLVKHYIAIPDPRVRMALVELVTSITKFFAKKAS